MKHLALTIETCVKQPIVHCKSWQTLQNGSKRCNENRVECQYGKVRSSRQKSTLIIVEPRPLPRFPWLVARWLRKLDFSVKIDPSVHTGTNTSTCEHFARHCGFIIANVGFRKQHIISTIYPPLSTNVLHSRDMFRNDLLLGLVENYNAPGGFFTKFHP